MNFIGIKNIEELIKVATDESKNKEAGEIGKTLGGIAGSAIGGATPIPGGALIGGALGGIVGDELTEKRKDKKKEDSKNDKDSDDKSCDSKSEEGCE